MKKIRVCCFLEKWESGGIESFLNSLFENTDLNKFEIDVVAAKLGESVFTDRLRKRGVSFFELSGNPRSAKNRARLRRLIKERHYDVLHLNVFHALTFAYAKDAERLGVPVRIAHAHGAGLRKSLTRPLKLLLHRLGRSLYGRALTARLACSDVSARFLFGKAADEIIRNGIDTRRFSYSESARLDARRELKISHAPTVGHVGRLEWEKNQAYLMRAFARVIESVPTARLLLVGEGPDRASLSALAEELEISDSVVLYGTSDNVPDLLSAMDVFALPSIFEGLGIVAIEAQASGLPTLLSEAVPPEAHATSLAESFPLTDGGEALAKRIISLLKNLPERRSYADEIELAGYSSSATARQIEKYYTSSSGDTEL